MLRKDCEKCFGDGDILIEQLEVGNGSSRTTKSWVPCNECGGEGRVAAAEDMKVYVNVYSITRHYGGPEEGGWYYNWFECLECVPCKNKNSEAMKEELQKEYEDRKHGNIYSVLGGTDIDVYIEENRCESQSKERPHYE